MLTECAANNSAKIICTGSGRVFTSSCLLKLSDDYREIVFSGSLVLHAISNTADSISSYFALLGIDCAQMLVNPNISDRGLNRLIEKFNPDFILGFEPSVNATEILEQNYVQVLPKLWKKSGRCGSKMPNALKLLVSTSGSTGSPKFVALSKRNLLLNCTGITERLNLKSTNVTFTSLPPAYSYGISILNTYMSVGATVYVIDNNPISQSYRTLISSGTVTDFNGVPSLYEMWSKLGYIEFFQKSAKLFTIAGGYISPDRVEAYYRRFSPADFYVMYGKTEMAPRVSILHVNTNLNKLGSVGRPLQCISASVTESGELVYVSECTSPGYVENRIDCELLDCAETPRKCMSEDLGRIDDDGYIYISGRVGRTVKVFDLRVDLDFLEKEVQGIYPDVYIDVVDEFLILFYVESGDNFELMRILVKSLGYPGNKIIGFTLDFIPLNDNGKPDRAEMLDKYTGRGQGSDKA